MATVIKLFSHKWSLLSGAFTLLTCLAYYLEFEFAAYLPQTCGVMPWPLPPIPPLYTALSRALSLAEDFSPLLAIAAAFVGMSKREPAAHTRIAFTFGLLSLLGTSARMCA